MKRAGQDLMLREPEHPAGQTPYCGERDETVPCGSSPRNPSQGPQEENERNAESDVHLGQARGIAQPKGDASNRGPTPHNRIMVLSIRGTSISKSPNDSGVSCL